jgi:hypothetical protein
MTLEHSPRPGAGWEQETTTREVVVPDRPYGCRHCGEPLEGHGNRYHHTVGLHDWQAPPPNPMPVLVPVPKALRGLTPPAAPKNRATRRAEARALRQKGHHR